MDTTINPAIPSSTLSREPVTGIDLAHARQGYTSTSIAADGTSIPTSEVLKPGPNLTLIAILVSAAVLVLVVGLGVIFLLKRRLSTEAGAITRKESKVRPWSGQSHTSEQFGHNDRQNSVDDFQAGGEDIEMQPSFAFHPDVALTDEDFPDSCSSSRSPEEPMAREKQSTRQRKSGSERESVVFDAKNKSFKLRADDPVSNGNTMRDDTKEIDETKFQLENEFIPGTNDSYAVVNKTLKRTKDDYDLAKVVTNSSNVIKSPSNSTEGDASRDKVGEQYVDMVLDDEEEGEMYVNNATIRSSHIERTNDEIKEKILIKPSTKLDVPNQLGSEIDSSVETLQRKLTKHPKPQPRLSKTGKRKVFDAYDYVPGIAVWSSDIPANEHCVEDVVENQSGPDNIHIGSPTNGDSDIGTGDVYDYPRSRESIDGKEDTMESEWNTDSIYDVPPSRYDVS